MACNDASGFIATAKFEETIKCFGEGGTAEAALQDFINSGEFAEHCVLSDIEDEEYVEVRIFKAIYKDSPKWNEEDYDPGWAWVLGEQVDSKQIQYLM